MVKEFSLLVLLGSSRIAISCASPSSFPRLDYVVELKSGYLLVYFDASITK